MSRSRRATGPTISLFPFLAVLLCTMGALLVLLVLFSRSAQHGAASAQVAERARAEEDLALARDNLAWRLEQVRGIRDRTAEDLAKARMQLAGIEENTRELTDELARLEQLARALEGEPRIDDAAAAEIAALEERLKNAKESLDEKRKELAAKPPAYAVVPYVGKAGTHRRPLYIECCIDGVFLQPEGIRLSPGDFEGPPGPGNPLASALRAAREHIAKTSTAPGDAAAQPYPLLLVRPSGVMAYYAAREAIQSWGSEFGYQLIDEDWTLTFPPRDPTLAEVERRAVEESRERLAWLAQSRPARPSRPPQQYRAATTRGGVVSNGGPSVLGDQSRFDWSAQQKARGFAAGDGAGEGSAAGPFGGTGGSGSTAGASGGGGDVLTSTGSGGGGNAAMGTGTASGTVAGGGGRGGQGTGSGVSAAEGAGPGGGPGDGPGGEGSPVAGGAGNDPAGGRYAGGSAFGGGRGDQASGGAGDATAMAGVGGGTSASGSAQGGNPAGGGSGAAGGSSAGQASGTGGGGGGANGQAMPGMLSVGGSAGPSSAGSMAQSRGKNWASLATADRPVPLTRPIHVECAIDEVRLFDDGARRVQTRIPLGANTADSVDMLVRAVHDRVSGWGIAGDRMYWRPELILSETSDGRSRREDIERLLADSGLDTRRKGDDGIRRLPPVERSSAMITSP